MLNADAKAFSVAIKTQKQPFLRLNKTPSDQTGQWIRFLSKVFFQSVFAFYLSGVNKHNQMFNPLVKMDHFKIKTISMIFIISSSLQVCGFHLG